MRKLVLTLVLVTQSTLLLANDCRDAVVEAYQSIGVAVERDSFSNSNFEDFNISIDEFNLLDSEQQQSIYVQIRPLEDMVQATIAAVNSKIARYAGTFYEIYVIDKLELWRGQVDKLKVCTISN